MLYLIDANVLIDANRDYYPMNRVPEFWSWLLHQADANAIKLPKEVHDEVKSGSDDLARWVRRGHEGQGLLLDEEADVQLVRSVTAQYAIDLTDEEVVAIGHDSFLIAYALADAENRCVVTTEASKPSTMRQNRRVPDVCEDLNVRSCNTFELIRNLDFSTTWRSR